MIDRSEWCRCLKALPTEQLLALTETVSKQWTIRPKAVPQSGLGMLKLNDSAFEEAFYLGEFPLSFAWVEIQIPDGRMAEGAAQVMDDRLEVAEALAVCDATLSARLPGWEQVEELVQQGLKHLGATDRERKKILASTQVDFALLDDVGDDNA